MLSEQMSVLDRTTLVLWRSVNIVGWMLGALIAAIAVNFAAEILFVDVLDAAIDVFTDGAIVPYQVSAPITSLVVGGVIGAVLGSRVYRAPVVVAAVAAMVYLAVSPFGLLRIGEGGAWMAGSAVVHLAAAIIVARVISRRRSGRAQSGS